MRVGDKRETEKEREREGGRGQTWDVPVRVSIPVVITE